MLTRGRGVRWHLPFRPVGLSPVFNHFSRGGGRLPRHAFPPISPAPVSCNCGAAYPPLRGSCEFFGFSHLPFTKKFCKDLRPGTGGRLCSPNLRFWRPALSIELHPDMCAFRLIVTHLPIAAAKSNMVSSTKPFSGKCSFQRDSASWSSHLEYSVTMPLGRSTGADSVSTRSAGRSRFLRVGTLDSQRLPFRPESASYGYWQAAGDFTGKIRGPDSPV